MKNIDEAQLKSDLGYRFGYLTEFIGFGEEDIKIIHGAAALLGPLVPTLVDAVYDKLSSYDSTWRHFLPRQHGYEGDVPGSLEELTMDHPQIVFRQQHLARYLERLVTAPHARVPIVLPPTNVLGPSFGIGTGTTGPREKA